MGAAATAEPKSKKSKADLSSDVVPSLTQAFN